MKIEKLSNKDLYRLCQKYGGNALTWRRKFIALLPEVEKRKLYKKHGFYSIFEFAAKLGGIKHKTVEEVLRVSRRVEDKPLLRQQIASVGYAKVSAVATIATKKNEEEMVELIKVMPKQALQETVRQLKISTPTGRGTMNTLSFKIDSQTEFRLRKFKQELEKQKKRAISFSEAIKALLDNVEHPVAKKSNKTNKSRNKTTRHIPVETKQKIYEKYGDKCAFPGCNKPKEFLHHTERFAISKSHNKIIPLCKVHHHIAHSGLIQNEQSSPTNWKIRDQGDPKDIKILIDKKYLNKIKNLSFQP